jgi:hydrogenase maturation protease
MQSTRDTSRQRAHHWPKRILIAGLGNIFLGDDGFGVEVARQLARAELPEEVRVFDFGIRPGDLRLAVAESYEAVVLVDATPRGQAPGTVYLIEPDLSRIGHAEVNAKGASTNPASVAQIAESLGGQVGRLLVVGCEPARDVRNEDARIGLTNVVRQAIPRVIELIRAVVNDLLKQEPESVRLAA